MPSVVAVEEAAEAAEQRAFLASTAAALAGCADDAVSHAAEGQRLEPDMAGAAQGGEEEAFAAEQRGLDLADELNVELDRGLEGHDAAGIDAQGFADAELLL